MAGYLEPLQLLRTKLYQPRPTGELIHRARVCEALDRHLDRAVTLVCAPAGFGKTTLLIDWLEHTSLPSAWLSLDKGDSDLGTFLSYFVAAIRKLFPTACTATLALLEAAVLPPLTPLVTVLSNDLDDLARDPASAPDPRFILVLDDYHLIGEPAVHSLLGELLEHPPRTMHLVISARQEPPFLLHGLRARGELHEIRVHDLRFTHEETALFMERALGTPLDPETLAALAEQSEGWGTGLRLAALAMSAGGDTGIREMASAADNRYVLDYLMNEVLSRVPPAAQDFLLKTSILDRMCGPLCDAVAEPGAGSEGDAVAGEAAAYDGAAYLQWLAAQNAFTFSLDAQGAWYRYHHLFRNLLKATLERQHGPQEIARLHGLAGAWFAQIGLVEEAIDHALAAGDEMMVVHLVEAHRHEAMNREQWRQLERWLRLIPRRLIEARPELQILEAWMLLNQWRFLDLGVLLDRIDALVEQVRPPEPLGERLRAEIDAFRSAVFYYLLDGERSFACAKRALEATPLECSAVRGLAWLYYAGSRHLTGSQEAALDAFHEGLQEDRLHGNAFATRLYMGLCLMHWIRADLPSMVLAATQMSEVARQRDLTEAASWAQYFLGCAYYQLNDLAHAGDAFGFVVGHRYSAHSLAFSQSGFGLASVFQARGEPVRAREVANSVEAYALEMAHPRVRSDAQAFGAWLALRRGSAAEAQRWALLYDPKTPAVPMTTFHVAMVARAKILVAGATASHHADAARAVATLRDLATTTHNTRYLIEALALEALLQDTQGDREAALAPLKRAIHLAEPAGMVRVFVDLGPRMAILLRLLAAKGVAVPYVLELLAAFGQEQEVHAGPAEGRADEPELIEPLTTRELEVLDLLAARMTDKEIARELNVAVQTVKRHASNIYQKLQAKGRREAVEKAATLGLIPPRSPSRPASPSTT